MKCMLINCRSVKNKVADIAAITDEHKPDIILGNESWLTPDIGNNEIFPIDYNVFRKDRITNTHGGGVFQAVKKDIIITERADLNTNCEIIWTQCKLAERKFRCVLFGSYYRTNASDMRSLEELEASYLKIGDNIHKNNVIIAGDFNAPDIDWQNPVDSNRLVELIDDHDFSQLVHEPTRRQGETHNTLDLVLSNNKNIVRNVQVVPGISNHDIVLFTVNTTCKMKKNIKRKIYFRKKADTNRIKEELKKLADSVNLNSESKTVDEKWNEFELGVHRIMDDHIPHKMSSSRYNLPWFNSPLRRQARAKQRLYNKAKNSRNPTHWHQFRAARKRMHQSLKTTRDGYVSNFLGEAIEENPKRFWSYVKQLRHDDPDVADLEIEGKIFSNREVKAEILNKQFSSVFTNESESGPPSVGTEPKSSISPLMITISGVTKQLTSLKTNKACGPDNIPSWFLKEYAQEILPVLTDIYQDSINTGIVPLKWRNANVCADFKKGKKSDPVNYRPISLTCIASKILEHIIHSHVMNHLQMNNVRTDCQHGFRAKRSTESQLILSIHDLTNSLDKCKSVHAVVSDFAKAFDKVPHRRLLAKLQYYGVQGKLLCWFESFLTQRSQSVVCEGKS